MVGFGSLKIGARSILFYYCKRNALPPTQNWKKIRGRMVKERKIRNAVKSFIEENITFFLYNLDNLPRQQLRTQEPQEH